jgi:hypothetical protein
MQRFEQKQDGCHGDYLALRNHHLGKSTIAALALEAERDLGKL